MNHSTDIIIKDVAVYFVPISLRVPLKFGRETLTTVTCSRILVTVENQTGIIATGWGETPLSVPWVWPSSIGYQERQDALEAFSLIIADAWKNSGVCGHPITIGHDFIENQLNELQQSFNNCTDLQEDLPWLAALVCLSPFDLACHDAYGIVNNIATYKTYNAQYMNADLASYIEPAEDTGIDFSGLYPEDFFSDEPAEKLVAWHLVGGKDFIGKEELSGNEPDDGYPVLLTDWIERDGLKALKVKLRGIDSEWDFDRLIQVGRIAREHGVVWLTADFNCTVTDPSYVITILERLMNDAPDVYAKLLYVEQPFPYELSENLIDVHGVSSLKPLFMDESAHDWKLLRLGRKLGWNGVALKTCKTQTGALLSLSWAKAHGMSLMVQDLTNPMLAQIPHVLLAAHAGTIMGVESNSMQFYPEASLPEAEIHEGLYTRKAGQLDLSSLGTTGFGYRIDEIERILPEPAL